ncbi:MAG: LysR family transcriptional regulator [Myxococcota bacterium]
MGITKFQRHDLNLLLLLHVLLEERSVTAAAARLGLTQGAASRALKRLRDEFGDELFVRSGQAMVPTPRAARMRDSLERLLHELGLLLEPEESLRPDQLDCEFRIAADNYSLLRIVPGLIAALRHHAPHTRLELETLNSRTLDQLNAGDIDLLLASRNGQNPGLVWSQLVDEPLITVARQEHPRVTTTMSLDDYFAEEHVLVIPSPSRFEQLINGFGRGLRVAARLPSYRLLPPLISESDLLTTLPAGALHLFDETPNIQRLKVPFLEDLRARLEMCWHERLRRDPAQRWLRSLVARVADEFAGHYRQ